MKDFTLRFDIKIQVPEEYAGPEEEYIEAIKKMLQFAKEDMPAAREVFFEANMEVLFVGSELGARCEHFARRNGHCSVSTCDNYVMNFPL